MRKRNASDLILLTGMVLCLFTGYAFSQPKPADGQDTKNEVHFSSEKISSEGFTLSYVEAVKWTMSSAGKTYPAMIIQLANYDRGTRSYHPNPTEEGQRRVMINFSGPAGQALKATTYSIDGGMGKDYRLSVGIEKKGASIGLYNGEGSGEIIHINDKTITARIDVRDSRGTTIRAFFTCPYEMSRY